MTSNVTENQNFSLWIETLKTPYSKGWEHLSVALTPEDQAFKEARNYPHGKQYPTITFSERFRYFCKGAVLCIPVINIITEAASKIFHQRYQHYTKPPAWKRINHIVVLMLENRSFDNLLGGLYPKSPQFNGLDGSEENSYTDRAGIKHTIKVWDSKGVRMDTPNPDPGEKFDDMTYQIFETNQPALHALPSMSGFAQNYYDFICRDKVAQKELRKKKGFAR